MHLQTWAAPPPRSHNPKVAGSSPAPAMSLGATRASTEASRLGGFIRLRLPVADGDLDPAIERPARRHPVGRPRARLARAAHHDPAARPALLERLAHRLRAGEPQLPVGSVRAGRIRMPDAG